MNALYSADARYVDPLAVAQGSDAIDSMIAAVQAQFPGLVFRLAGPVDGHKPDRMAEQCALGNGHAVNRRS